MRCQVCGGIDCQEHFCYSCNQYFLCSSCKYASTCDYCCSNICNCSDDEETGEEE